MFRYLIKITPLGLMYGSAGAFLSPENLVGRSGHKFPPDAAAVAGLLLNSNREQGFPIPHSVLRESLYVAGPFWAEISSPFNFYVPVPRHQIIAEDQQYDEWKIEKYEWTRSQDETKRALESGYHWQSINQWNKPTGTVARNTKAVGKEPWKSVAFLHPKMKDDERVSLDEDGLFLENAFQLDDRYCLIYLSTHPMPDGWYRFGGEGHMVEVEGQNLEITEKHSIYRLLRHPIQQTFALITPGVWGSNNLSYRYPKHPDFPKDGIKILTDKPVPHRFRLGASKSRELSNQPKQPPGRLGRGRYAVPAGTVYVLKRALNEQHSTWWRFPDDWFPREGKGIAGEESKEGGLRLKHFGCGLCLPVTIQGVNECTTEPTALSKP
ncbi:MAG: CRISPR-associated protein [Elainella sp. C42_A2020_010]|nr:CRISPR-associated protein [Elainella sp. C42_A2020_010]